LAVKGSPSDHFMPERMWYVNVMLSLLVSTLVVMEFLRSASKFNPNSIGRLYSIAQIV